MKTVGRVVKVAETAVETAVRTVKTAVKAAETTVTCAASDGLSERRQQDGGGAD